MDWPRSRGSPTSLIGWLAKLSFYEGRWQTMAGNNNGNNMRSIESSKSSIPSQDCNEAVTSSSATPPAAACHWPVQHRNTTMLMTQIYVEYVSYWMTQHVFSRFKARRKVSNLRSSIWHGITSKGNARKSIKCKSCIFSSWLRDRTPRGGISIPSPTQKSKNWVWARYCSKSSPYKYRGRFTKDTVLCTLFYVSATAFAH